MATSNAPDSLVDALTRMAAWYLAAPATAGPVDEPDEIREARRFAMAAIGSLKEGDTDPWLGKTITTVVRKSTHYIVYLDECQELQWWWIRRPADMLLVGRIQAEVSRLEHESAFLLGTGRSWHEMAWPSEVRAERARQPNHALRSVRMLIGEAVAIALNGGDEADCQRALSKAEESILLSKEQHCRPDFFVAFALTVAAIGLVHWLLTACGSSACWTGGEFSGLWREAAFAGAMGAFVSAMLRTRELKLEPSAGRAGVRIDAVARALIGAAAGVLVVMAYDSGLILKAAVEAGADKSNKAIDEHGKHALRVFLALAAGTSERLLPSLVGRAEALVSGASGSTAAAPPARPPARTTPPRSAPADRQVDPKQPQ